MLDTVSLNGPWRFMPDPYGDGEGNDWPDPSTDALLWREVWLPCPFDDCAPGLHGYEGPGWFRRDFQIDDHGDRRVSLRFGAVNYHARIWVNGIVQGEHEGGFLPFEFDVTGAATPGVNSIVVRADSTRRPGAVPGMKRGWRPYGGVIRSVELVFRDAVAIKRSAVIASHTGALHVTAWVRNASDAPERLGVRARVIGPNGEHVGLIESDQRTLDPGEDGEFRMSTRVQARPWSPGDPVLYTAELSISGMPSAEPEVVRFGFRTIEAVGEELRLNGEPIRLFGFNRHEDSPGASMCADPDRARRDLMHMKEMGANFVRLCHYPHDPSTLDLCDELGLLVMAEIPLYWWEGDADGEDASSRTLEQAASQLAELVVRDANHPSVVFWSVGNETAEDRPEVAAGMQTLVSTVKAMDPTRLAVHVSDKWARCPSFDADDVICVNAYPSWSPRAAGRHVEWTPEYASAWWRSELTKLHDRWPGKPVLVTEYGHPALCGLYAGALGEDAQAQAIATEAEGMDLPFVCGRTVWCYADHPWPEEDFIRRMTTSPFGVVSRDRVPKVAAGALKLAVTGPGPTHYGDAGWRVRMVRRDLLNVPDQSLPDGFAFRGFQPGDGAAWTDIHRDARPGFDVDGDLFASQFGDDLPAMPHRSVFVVDEGGTAVATATAWYVRDPAGDNTGLVHWVAVRQQHQNRGVGRALVAEVLRRMSRWHKSAALVTASSRLAAIRVYLALGFEPDMTAPDAAKAWAEIRASPGMSDTA